MIQSLSILMPTHNNVCVELVKTLQRQAAETPGLEYEILVADDGSTDAAAVRRNREIGGLPHCRYVERKENVGRAAIRNFLARESRCQWLLFADSDLRVDRASFVRDYCRAEGDVTVGGLKIGGDEKRWKDNLRYRYEKACEKEHDCPHRQKNGDRDFRTTNFLISRAVAQECPFDEDFRHYGYEDVLFGKMLTAKGFRITHIDNPILMDDYEDNALYMLKTEEACRTLFLFRDELRGYSKLAACAEKLERRHLGGLLRRMFRLLKKPLRARLVEGRPDVFLFNVYRLLYYVSLEERRS